MVDFLATTATVALGVLALAVAVVMVTGQSPLLPPAERVSGYLLPGLIHSFAAGSMALMAWLAYSLGPGRAPAIDDLPLVLALPVGSWVAGLLAWVIRRSEILADQRSAALRQDRTGSV